MKVEPSLQMARLHKGTSVLQVMTVDKGTTIMQMVRLDKGTNAPADGEAR